MKVTSIQKSDNRLLDLLEIAKYIAAINEWENVGEIMLSSDVFRQFQYNIQAYLDNISLFYEWTVKPCQYFVKWGCVQHTSIYLALQKNSKL